MSEYAFLGSLVKSSRPALSKDRLAEIGDLGATGKTVAEAKANLAERIEYALTGSYEPIVIMHGGYVAIASRTLDGQWVSYIREGNGNARCKSYGNYRQSADHAEDDLRKTFAQFLDGNGIDGAPVLRAWHLDDLYSYRAWQAAYRIGQNDGMADPRAFADTKRSPRHIREYLADKLAPNGQSPYCHCAETHDPYCPDFVSELG